MFKFGKKKDVVVPIVPAASTEETMGLKEYVSIDSMKAHLVNILEENRRLKREAENNRDQNYKAQREEQKKAELALIEADEWKKRAKEKDEEIRKLKKVIDDQDKEIEQLTTQQTGLKADAEMAIEQARKTRERYAEKADCAAWLKDKKYCGYEWERMSKTQLIDILKKILNESEQQEEAESGDSE